MICVSPWAWPPTIQVVHGLRGRVLSFGNSVKVEVCSNVACTHYLVQEMLASAFITAHSLAWCLWWTYVVGTTQLRLILLEALPHIFALFRIRGPPDPAYLASVIDPGDDLTLWGPKVFSGPFFSSLEFRQLEALPLWESIRM